MREYIKNLFEASKRSISSKRVSLKSNGKDKNSQDFVLEILDFAENICDIPSNQRPVLLELIVKYLPQLVEKGEKINAPTLYDTTIHEEIKGRLRVEKTVIKRDDRVRLMKLLAIWVYNHDKLFLYYKDIPELPDLKVHFDLETRNDIDSILKNSFSNYFGGLYEKGKALRSFMGSNNVYHT